MAIRREVTFILYGLAAACMILFQFAPGQPITGHATVFESGAMVDKPVIDEHMAAWGVQGSPWQYSSSWQEEQPDAKELYWTGPLSLLALASVVAAIFTLSLPKRFWRLLPVALIFALAFATSIAQNAENGEAFDRCHAAQDEMYPSNSGGGCQGGTNTASVFLAVAAVFAAVGGGTAWRASGTAAASPLPTIES